MAAVWKSDGGRGTASWGTSYQLFLLLVPSEKGWGLEPGQGQWG